VKKKVLRIVLAAVVVLSLGLVSAGSVLANGPGAVTDNWACTEVVQFDGNGHAVFHINGHCTLLPNDGCKFNLHMQGQILCTDDGTWVWKFNKNIVCNGQAGEDGVFNGQWIMRTPCGDFHLIMHYANYNGWCKVVPLD